METDREAEQSDLEDLRFKVAPHIVQDLGLNLYTSLPRVLVEFVANAYDADSPVARITLDRPAITEARNRIRGEWKLEKERADEHEARGNETPKIQPLELRSLPPELQIVIEDEGCGMSRSDLQEKFLVAGRRRREVERSIRSPGGRLLMGRKGLGKLAGFGVAYQVEVISRRQGESHATRIVLNYNEIVKHRTSENVKVPTETIANGSELFETSGTRIVLSHLVYGPMKSTVGTISNTIGDHFSLIDESEFRIELAGEIVKPTPRVFVFAYPKPDIGLEELVSHDLKVDDDHSVRFRYRIRFTGPGQHLSSSDRGVRVYAHKRLAAAPDTLGLNTGIHGFRNTYYMDGVVHADFLDEDEDVDYVATDRQSLRWDTALLGPLKDFLVGEMQEACNVYQKKRDADAQREVKEDQFTSAEIEQAGLPSHRKRFAYRVAALLSTVCEGGTAGDEYRTHLPILVDGLAQGDVLRALAELATEEKPGFQHLLREVSKLTAQEIGDFMRVVQGRLNGIAALKKIVDTQDFKGPDNEQELHELLETSPWLIDPVFAQFITSNQSENSLQNRLAKELQIGDFVSKDYDSNSEEEQKEYGANRRPDLVFLLSSAGLEKIVIVELKAPNTPLHLDHLTQLKGYMRRTEKWLESQGRTSMSVQGYLIGSMAKPSSKSEKVEQLSYEIEKEMQNADWKVFDVMHLLERAEIAHREYLEINKQLVESEDLEG